MKKLTKKQYQKAVKLLETELETVQAILALAAETAGASLPSLDDWNLYNDREDEIEEAIKQVHRNYDQRDWTAADRNRAELIAQNID